MWQVENSTPKKLGCRHKIITCILQNYLWAMCIRYKRNENEIHVWTWVSQDMSLCICKYCKIPQNANLKHFWIQALWIRNVLLVFPSKFPQLSGNAFIPCLFFSPLDGHDPGNLSFRENSGISSKLNLCEGKTPGRSEALLPQQGRNRDRMIPGNFGPASLD